MPVELICQNPKCSRVFTVKQSFVKRGRKYCSNKCKFKDKSRNPTKWDNEKLKYVIKNMGVVPIPDMAAHFGVSVDAMKKQIWQWQKQNRVKFVKRAAIGTIRTRTNGDWIKTADGWNRIPNPRPSKPPKEPKVKVVKPKILKPKLIKYSKVVKPKAPGPPKPIPMKTNKGKLTDKNGNDKKYNIPGLTCLGNNINPDAAIKTHKPKEGQRLVPHPLAGVDSKYRNSFVYR